LEIREAHQMESIRRALPEALVKAMCRKLGREDALRLLWPALVGEKLAAQTRPSKVRGTTLIIGVPDPEWIRSLAPLSKMILEAVNRSAAAGAWQATAVELISDPQQFPAGGAARRSDAVAPVQRPPLTTRTAEAQSWQEVFSASERKYFARTEGAGK
jgi:Dna[CI] antecedent DciA-like protein